MNAHGRMIRVDSSKPAPPPIPAQRPPKLRPASWNARKRLRQVVEDWRQAERVIANQRLIITDQAKQISRLEGELQQATACARRWSKENHGLVMKLAEVSVRRG